MWAWIDTWRRQPRDHFLDNHVEPLVCLRLRAITLNELAGFDRLRGQPHEQGRAGIAVVLRLLGKGHLQHIAEPLRRIPRLSVEPILAPDCLVAALRFRSSRADRVHPPLWRAAARTCFTNWGTRRETTSASASDGLSVRLMAPISRAWAKAAPVPACRAAGREGSRSAARAPRH